MLTTGTENNGVSCHGCVCRHFGHHRSVHDIIAGGGWIQKVRLSKLRNLNVVLMRSRTKMIFHQLVMYLVTRGILVTLLQIGHIVMYAVDPSNLLFW
jgi:hypothetical protein